VEGEGHIANEGQGLAHKYINNDFYKREYPFCLAISSLLLAAALTARAIQDAP
jgi:hypothetical protein